MSRSILFRPRASLDDTARAWKGIGWGVIFSLGMWALIIVAALA